ncbi:hypothetical protein CC2G_007750 [Coprinopsis cinerea AmutBmut pab1-1]|nr:hypothetical protein CC2G_007750 [Coprinopsis cinerea AmutBmut pab1-1]
MATSLTTFRLASRSTSAAHTRLSTGLLRRTYVTSPEEEEKDVHYVINCITQGHVTDPNNRHKRDPMSQAYRAGMQARILSDAEFDAASMQKKEVPHEMGRGNKEHVGLWFSLSTHPCSIVQPCVCPDVQPHTYPPAHVPSPAPFIDSM